MEEHLKPDGDAAGKRQTKQEENKFESPVVRSLRDEERKSGKGQQEGQEGERRAGKEA